MKQPDNWRICAIVDPFVSADPDAYVHAANFIHLIEPLAEEIFVITSNFPENAISSRKIHIINVRHNINNKSINQSMLVKIPKFIIRQLKISYNLIKVANRIDILFLSIGTSSLFLPALYAKLLRKKIILLRHGTNSFQKTNKTDYQKTLFGMGKYIFPSIVDILIGLNCSLSDRLAVFTPNITDPRLRRYKNKITSGVSRYYVDTDCFKVEKRLDSRENLVGYIGRFEEIKGVMNFVSAIPRISEKSGVNFLIGGDGSLRGDIEKEIKNANLGDRVTVTGWIPHNRLPQYLNKVKLLVIPSYAEVGPQMVIEAMACGTPVLSTPVGIVPDVIKDEETGFIMENNSPECIARNVIRALNHPNLDQIAKAARELAEREYTPQAAVERYRRILSSLSRKTEHD